jgi:cellulose synthase/poly-beta-1,6-N-acetylglucosamine synthase-like glycosyltransferase
MLLEIVFWASAGLLVFTHVGYPLALRALAGLLGRRDPEPPPLADDELPAVSLIVAGHDEEAVIAARVRDALALDYPRDRLQMIVASDGSTDRTAELAAAAGADIVLELPRGGKVAALNAAVERADGEVVAFSDANTAWEPDALRRLVARLAFPGVGYVCGRVGFTSPAGDNQEGLYWRYELAVRELESRLAGVTAGNGAINAIRRDAYVALPPERGQDIAMPFTLTGRGLRAVYEPRARATEPMAASIGDEFGRKRRMMTGAWGTMLSGGMLALRRYPPLYSFELLSHRFLRYVSPLLHIAVLAANLALVDDGWVYIATLAAQAALLLAAALAPLVPLAPLRIARYYVAVTAASLAGLADYIRHGVPVTWDQAEGTR